MHAHTRYTHLRVQVRGADIGTLESGIIKHLDSTSSSEQDATTTSITVPGQVRGNQRTGERKERKGKGRGEEGKREERKGGGEVRLNMVL